MGKFRDNRDNDTGNFSKNTHKAHKPYRGDKHRNDQNPVMAQAFLATQPEAVQISTETVKEALVCLFNGVERKYRFYGITSELRMFQPRNTEKPAYPMLFIEHVVGDHEVGDLLHRAMFQATLGLALADLRKHPDDVSWWATTEVGFHAKKALAYYLHSKQCFIEVATEYDRKENEKRARKQLEDASNKVEALRIAGIRRQLRTQFEPLTEVNAIELVRYVPGKRFSIFDKDTGTAVYVSTDVQKIYVEEVDPGHPLENINPVGLFINRAALRNIDEDGTPYEAMDEQEIAKKAYTLRSQLRNHPLIATALKPAKSTSKEETSNVIAFPVNQEEDAHNEGVYLGKELGSEASAAS
jgi:hypothetical protein